MSLYRDLLADYWEQINNDATVFIEKAMLPSSNELIFNSESMTFNQILRSQDLIKDKTGSPWIVGYLPIFVKRYENTHYFRSADIFGKMLGKIRRRRISESGVLPARLIDVISRVFLSIYVYSHKLSPYTQY
jgi:hypothetical protein